MDEFLNQKLDVIYQREIEAWFIYLDQKEFGYKLSKRILEEVNRFMANKKTIDEIIGELFEEPDWMKKIEEALIKKNQDLRVSRNIILGYA